MGSKAYMLMTMYVFLGGGHFSALESVQLGPAIQSPILFTGYYGFSPKLCPATYSTEIF